MTVLPAAVLGAPTRVVLLRNYLVYRRLWKLFLTGFLEPNAAFLLVKRGGAMSGTLFTASRDPRRALYDGFPPDSTTVAQQTGLSVRSLPALRPAVTDPLQKQFEGRTTTRNRDDSRYYC